MIEPGPEGERRASLSRSGPAHRSGCGKVRLSRHGVHYFDRTTGLNLLLDEVKVPEADWAPAPRYLSLALTNACDLRCSYCYAPKQVAAVDRIDVVTWAQELDDAGCLGIGFGGGEPTLYPHFPELCREIANRTQLAVTMTTHGHRVTHELARQLVGAIHFIRVSVDGVGRTYERNRGRRFSDLKASLELVAAVAPFGLNAVVTSETVDELDAIAQFAVDAGARELLLLPLRASRHSSALDAASSAKLTDWINSGVSHSVRIALSRSGLETTVPVADPFPGEDALDAHAHVDATSTLRPDAFSPIGTRVTGSMLESLARLRRLTA